MLPSYGLVEGEDDMVKQNLDSFKCLFSQNDRFLTREHKPIDSVQYTDVGSR